MLLSEKTNIRNNNFDFLRFLAAFIVLLWHCFVCFGSKEPSFYKYIPGGVPIFFVISGFLITKSWVDNPNIWAFFKKRILRIFPAFIVVVLFAALVLGPLVTTLPLNEYFTNPLFFDYFKNVFLYEIYHLLPGVFETVPYNESVNGSLWTLPVEFFMYVLAGIFGIVKLFWKKYFYCILIITSVILFFLFTVNNIVEYRYVKLLRLLIIFFIGSFLYINNKRILLSFPLFLTAEMLFIISVNTALFEYVQFFTLPYIVIFIAYADIPYVNNFGKFGDFSYGIYLWAFPVQQTLVYFFADKFNVYTYILSVFLITLFLGIISFRFIEKPALRLKKVEISRYLNTSLINIFKIQNSDLSTNKKKEL